MVITHKKSPLSLILKLLLSQFVAAAAITAIVWLAMDGRSAKSALLGLLCGMLPHTIFAWYVFRFHGADQVQIILKSIYRGEAIKFLFIVLLVTAVLKTVAIVPWIFFSAFCVALLLQVVLPLLINNDNWE
ncbi:ATP synthase subunit I [Rheinheimera sp.]|uniref:ATP synthase subunit I n=1 Tax=Rheinheimera sp. TaxID=1869214 RepID=UPI00307F7B07